MSQNFEKILIIQTAFIGDVILATVLIEKLHQYYPQAKIDFLLRKGNETLLEGHPFLNEVLIWNKKKNKRRNLFRLIRKVRKKQYDLLVNVQRFTSTGMITIFSGAKVTVGFDKNPFSTFFTKKIKHSFEEGKHEVERNLSLIQSFTDNIKIAPRLYPTKTDFEKIKPYQSQKYICIAPASVWFTKQFPEKKWIEFINQMDKSYQLYLLGSKEDEDLCKQILKKSEHPPAQNLAGKLSFLESAALMKNALMNYVNDSAPLHLASAVNAPVCVVYCSTTPEFGFAPLSDNSTIVQVKEKLKCRPCGLHGFKACPEGHFKCAKDIEVAEFLKCIGL